ncbi:methyltransferase type 11 [Actinorhabdospora filicis]|uniref:Methyltransferase type 11 n=1 Tax=Actinorhabdospora filicis TaxID=1785913 RepID=A0A9W6SIJ2_9ACTN|nr:class I SAM-dependent methyltransferase [Actinorhabdospora filicis]GLZ77725.1 methyltransferase type 11 [Actinorhabdospora filicis]
MPILGPGTAEPDHNEPDHTAPHRARDVAESFGADAEAYHRLRPRYPAALAEAVLEAAPGEASGRDVLDVGCGTGISAEHFAARGCRVLGVDPDARMADRARERGLAVEVARFEDWDARGRDFDVVISGQTWHWVDPERGPAKAGSVLRPGGRLALFWNAASIDADLAARLTEACPGIPPTTYTGAAYDAMAVWAAEKLSKTFTNVTTTAFPWSASYERDAWVAMQLTTGIRGGIDAGAFRNALPASVDVEYRAILVTGITDE